MAATIIDSLLVTLGLDTKSYQKGRADAERANKQFKESTKKQADELSSALVDLGKSAAALFLGFEGAKAGLQWLGGLNTGSAQLGRFSKNLGESVHAVQAWDNAVELAGGSSKDAESDLLNLSNSITALRATGEVSPLVLLFQRMGVAIYDAQGNVRKLTDLYKDLGDKLRQYNRADAFNLASQAGLSESTFNLIRAEADERQRLLEVGEQNAKQNENSTAAAAEAQAQWKNLRQEIDNVGRDINSDLSPAIQFVLKFAASAALVVWNRLRAIGDAIGNVAAVGGALFHGDVSGAVNIARDLLSTDADRKKREDEELNRIWNGQLATSKNPEVQGPRQGGTATPASAIRNNNPGNIRYVGQASATGQDSRGFAVFPDLATGIREANRQLDRYAARGINTVQDIVSKWAPLGDRNNTPAYIADVSKKLGVSATQQLGPADRQRLLQAIFGHEGNAVSSGEIAQDVGTSNALATARVASAATSQPTKTGGGSASNSTQVEIDSINIYPPNGDPNTIASGIAPALQRKGIVAQADSGMS